MPNLAVDVDSWARSACYPRSTFYPLSDGHSTLGRRITRACFRTCSARPPRSQAGLHSCALGTVADRPEPTFARLRYILGGDRPSQTTRLARSAALRRMRCGGIPPFGPRRTSPRRSPWGPKRGKARKGTIPLRAFGARGAFRASPRARHRARKEKRPPRARRPALPQPCAAVLSAMAGLTAGFGMGPGDPRLCGRARGGRSPAALLYSSLPGTPLRGDPGGRMAGTEEDGASRSVLLIEDAKSSGY